MESPLVSFGLDLFSQALFERWAGVPIVLLLCGGAISLGLLAVPREDARPALRALAGFPLFFLLWGSFGVLLFLLGGTVLGGLLAGCIVSLFLLWRAARRGLIAALRSRRELALLGLLLASGFVLAVFGWGETLDGTIRATHGAWGDGPLHTLFAEAFVRRAGRDFSMPAFAGEIIREPFGYDFVAAMLRSVGFTVGGSFTLPVAALLACVFAWSAHLAAVFARSGARGRASSPPGARRRITPATFAAAISLVLLPAFGGLQWLVFARREGAEYLSRFFGVHETFWAKAEELGLIWENHLVIFSSQKHLLLAAAFILVLAGVFLASGREKRSVEGSNGRSALTDPVFVLAAGTGVLPLFHMHAFLGAGLLWISAALVTRSRRLFFGGVLAALLALPLVIWLAGLFSRSGFLAFEPGWMATGGYAGWLRFWLVNLGVFLPLSVLAVWRGIRRQRSDTLILALPSLILFVLANLVRFQPYRWDNFKMFLLAWLLLTPLVAAEMARWRFPLAKFIAVSLLILMSLTTLADARRHLWYRARYPVYTPASRSFARTLDARLPGDAVVLAETDTAHNHALTLTGRTLVSAYGGWMWSRGYAWEERARVIDHLRALDWEAICAEAPRFGVTHVLQGRRLLSLDGTC